MRQQSVPELTMAHRETTKRWRKWQMTLNSEWRMCGWSDEWDADDVKGPRAFQIYAAKSRRMPGLWCIVAIRWGTVNRCVLLVSKYM